MNIAATVNSNYAAALLSAGAATPPVNGRAAIIADILARILQPTLGSANAAAAPNSSAAIILTQLLSSTNSAPMELNLNQLLNTLAPKALAQLPPELLAKPQVIQALVLQNTLLSTTSGSTTSTEQTLPLLTLPTPASTTGAPATTNTLYRVNIEWQNKLIQLLSPQPLPVGTRVPLQIDPPQGANTRGAITLLRPEIAAKLLLAQNPPADTAAAQPPLASTPERVIQQSLRELLPRQQALHTLVPLLQKFIAPSVREQLPQPVFKALAQLLQALPKPAQLNNAESVKQAINNSGSFLEAKVAQTAIAPANAQPLPQIAATDLKAQIATLLTLIRQYAPPAAATKSTTTPPAPFVAEEDFVYTKPSLHTSTLNSAPARDNESLDSVLTQLGKLLQAGFARIQLNQLDSVSVHHSNHEAQIPVPTWVIELPLRTPHGVDQLQLRIEQRRKQQQQRTRVQWNVEIAFDLHKAGKIAASLAIVDKTVSATLWAEQEQTHRRVRDEMDYLRAGLEAVGVNVTDIQCRHGLPTPRSNPISQQLVDVHL